MATKVLKNLGEFGLVIDEKISKGKDLTEYTKRVAGDMESKIQFRFRQSKSPDGVPWEKLSKTTLDLRRKASSKPLLDSGLLLSTISSSFTSTGAIAGSNSRYGRYQQAKVDKGDIPKKKEKHSVKSHTRTGKSGKKYKVKSFKRKTGNIPWGDKPSRPFIGFSNNQIKNYHKWLLEYING